MFSVDSAALTYVGEGLARAECVMATRSGDLFMPDKRGGVSVVRADGRTELILAKDAPKGFMPNGFALLPDRSFLIADLGPEGGVWHMTPDGVLSCSRSTGAISSRPISSASTARSGSGSASRPG
jgi:sugar lactone lactonase YvrE